MVEYYCQFIPRFAELAKPLVRLLHKEVPFAWGNEKAAAFSSLCEVLASSPVLAHPAFESPFILFTDASDVSIVVKPGGLPRAPWPIKGRRSLVPAWLLFPRQANAH